MIWRLAWRGLLRNPRRTAVLVAAVAVGISGCFLAVHTCQAKKPPPRAPLMRAALPLLNWPSLPRSSGLASRRPCDEWASRALTTANATQLAIQAFFHLRLAG